MPMRAQWMLLIVAVALLAGCSADGASTGNFTLTPQRVGWYAGEEAHFTLTIESSLLRSSPTFVIDRRFAIEEIQLNEEGLTFGGDYETKEPDDVGLRLERAGVAGEEWTLDTTNATLDVFLTLPSDLRDSEYHLELDLFNVGWVESGTFRVDLR